MLRAEDGASVAETLSRLFDAGQRLASQSLRLARSELRLEAANLGRRAGRLLAAGALVLLGLGLLNAAVGVVLAPRLGLPGALAGLAAANLAAGGLLFAGWLRPARSPGDPSARGAETTGRPPEGPGGF